MKKIISLLLSLILVLSSVAVFAADNEEAIASSKVIEAIANGGFELITSTAGYGVKVSGDNVAPVAFRGNDMKLDKIAGYDVLNLPSWSNGNADGRKFTHTFANGAVLTAVLKKTGKTVYVSSWETTGDVEIGAFIVRGHQNRYNVYAYDNLTKKPSSDTELYTPYSEKGEMIPITHITIFFKEKAAEVPGEAVEEDAAVKDASISLKDVNYAYIFGYQPVITKNPDGTTKASVHMGMSDNVTVEQVCAMLLRILDTAGITNNTDFSNVKEVAVHQKAWYGRGLAYVVTKGGFNGEKVKLGPITRGQVAKIVACSLDLNLTGETNFPDVATSKYKNYIEIVNKYGYMNGKGNGKFAPNAYLTRAEFCQLINNIIGRDESYKLVTGDGSGTAVTPATYSIDDMDPNHWAYETCLRATSCFDENKCVDLASRKDNIRNKLDHYNGQTEY